MNLGTLVVKLLLERAQFKTELAQTVQDVNTAATQVQGRTAAISGAVTDAVTGQTTAVQTATRALTVLGPVAATALAAVAAVGYATHQAHQETQGYEKAIILTGNAAGVTAGQLGDMAKRIDGVVGTQANAAAALTAMTAGGKVARENLEKVSLAAIEMERATGQAIGETEKIFSSLGKEPVKASLRLNESLNYLTASTYAQIKAAENMGDTERAVSIAQNAAADMLRDRAAKVEKNLGTIERAWRGVRDLAKEAWDAMLNVGRPDSSANQLSKAGERVAYLEKQVEGRRSRGLATGDLDGQLAAAKALHDTLRETARLDERAAGIKADLAAKDKARIDLAQALEQSASKQEKMAIAIAQANALADRAGASAAERAQLVNAAREKYAEKESKATKAALTDYDKLMQRLGVEVPKAAAEAEAAQQGYNKSQTEFLALAGSPAWAKFTNDQRATVAALFEKKIASEQATAATKAEEKATVEAVKAREKALATGEKELEKLRASVVAQQEQNARLGLTKEAIAELDAAKLEMLATDLELQAIKAMDRNLDEAQYELLKRQAQAYRDLAQAKRDGAAKQAAIESGKELEKAADKAAKEGERAAERIEQSLTDALMRGFESGKDMARNLRDTVVNMFKTMVLRPVVSAFVNPIAGAITGALGLGGASAGQSGGGSAGTLLNGASLLGRVGGTFGMGLSSGFGALFGEAGLMGALDAGAIAMGAGNVAGGLGTIMGALGPIAIGIALLSSLIKKSTPHMGGGSSYSAAEGLRTGKDQYTTANYGFADTRTYDATAGRLTGDVAKSVVGILDSAAISFGKQAGYAVSTAFADDKSKDGAWGSLVIGRGGAKLLDWRDTQTSKWAPREFADGEAGQKEWLAEIAKDVRGVLVKEAPGWARDMLESLGDSPTLEGLASTVDSINAAAAALDTMGKNLVGFAGLTDEAISALVKASGGMAGLISNASTFYDNFYSPEEKRDRVKRDITDRLSKVGITGIDFDDPKARDKYRKLVEDSMAKSDEQAKNRKALAESFMGAAGKGGKSLSELIGSDGWGAIDPALTGGGKDNPEARKKLEGFLADVDKVVTSGKSPAEIDKSLSSLIDMNAEILGLGDDAAAATAALLGASGAFASVTQSAEEARAEAQSTALRALERAVAAEKRLLDARIDAASTAVSELSGLFGLLHDSARDMYGSVSSTSAMLAAQGQDFITQALATARATGYLPEQDKLSEAISAVRAGISGRQFATQYEADRAVLVPAGQLSELEGMAGEQLSTAERTLKELQAQSDQLDQTMQYWRDQIELSQAGVDATLSVADAVAHLEQLMFPEADKPGGSGSGGGAGSGAGADVEVVGGAGPGARSAPPKPGQRTKDGDYYREVYLGDFSSYRVTSGEETARLDRLASDTTKWQGTGDVRGLLLDAKESGYTLSDLATVYGWSYKDLLERAEEEGVPRFERGGMHAGGLRLVGERGWEVEATGPARYWNQQQLGQALSGSGNTARLEALVEVLTRRVESLQSELSAIRGNTGGLPQLVDQFDNVSESGNVMRNKPVGAPA